MADKVSDELNLLSTENGDVLFSPDSIATIAGVAAAEVKGVAGMSGGIVDGIVQILGRKNFKKGIKADIGRREAAITLNIVVNYGFVIPNVCRLVQREVKEAVETMTGLNVISVDVVVNGINFDKENKPAEKKPESAAKPK